MPLVPGQAIGTGIGATTPTPTVPLRSNKTPAALLARPLGGQATFATPGSVRAARSRALTGVGISTAQHSFIGAPPSVVWDIGDIEVLSGQSGQPGGQFDLEPTLPAGVMVDGVFELDLASAALPAGMTLSSAGMVDVGSASVETQSGIVVAYTEPGGLPTLTLHNGTVTGTLPYMATWFPTEGMVPAGMSAVSPDDATLRGSVLSTWPDGSAQVIVVAGRVLFAAQNTTQAVRLRAGPVGGAPLSDARLAELVSSVTVNFGGTPQTLTIADATRDHIWWANERVICGRYRLSCGLGVMEAIIDIHAFDVDRAFVEVVIENGQFDPSSVSTPASQTYTSATVAVNGSTIETVSTTSAPNGAHEAFRAWYCSGWVGGDPLVEVTHDTASLQAHPWFWKQYTPQTYSQTAYDTTYSPWLIDWLPASGMGNGGETSVNGMSSDQSTWIGPLPAWEAAYIQTGNRLARKAVLTAGLEVLRFNINYRDSTTHRVPTSTAMQGKEQGFSWPRTTTEPAFDDAHQPATGLVAFMCRPSPCFIESAQKVFCWNHTDTTDGRFGYKQVRARAWAYRNYAQAIFLTPDTTASGSTFSAWKSSARALLGGSYADINLFRQSWNTLNVMYGLKYDNPADDWDHSSVRPHAQRPLWEHYWLATVANWIVSTKVITDLTNAAAWADTANWLFRLPVDYINGSTNGEWRLQNYTTTYGDISGSTVVQATTWGATLDSDYTGTPPIEAGPFLFAEHGTDFAWTDAVQSWGYAQHFWLALTAAVERDVSGALTAYNRAVAALPSSTHTAELAARPRYNAKPRNV